MTGAAPPAPRQHRQLRPMDNLDSSQQASKPANPPLRQATAAQAGSHAPLAASGSAHPGFLRQRRHAPEATVVVGIRHTWQKACRIRQP